MRTLTSRLLLLLFLACLPGQAWAQSSVRGMVMGADGGPRPDAIVRLAGMPAATSAQPQPQQIVQSQRADSDGNYRFEKIPAGSYALSADAPSTAPGTVANSGGFTLGASDNLVRNLLLLPPPSWADPRSLRALAVTVAASAMYLLFLLLYRFYNIIAPARALLAAQIDSVKIRLDMEADPAQAAEVARLTTELTGIKEGLGRVSWGSTLFWSRGEEIAAWSRIHEVERQLATFLAPLSRVLVRVHTAEGELRVKATPASLALADRIRINLQALAAITDPAASPQQAEAIVMQLKHELAEGLALIYGERDTGFSSLMEWQNKAMWLSTVALLIIVALALVFEHEWLFLIGAAGGLMSRLARSLFRDNLPTDYGASWTTLFLSPLVGAIAAWFGILIIAALVAAEVLGPVMAGVRWPPAFDALTIALAFTLGFSERLFTTLVATVEAQVRPNTTPVPPTPPVGGGGGGPIPPGPDDDGGGGGRSGGPRPVAASTSAVHLLDLTSGERAAVIGDQDSPARQTIAGIVGAANVFVVGLAQLATVAPVDAVLLERPPDVAELEAAAAAIRDALAPNGRVVVIGSTPAGLFDADARTLLEQKQHGPALMHEVMTTAGLLAQEPPERLDGVDPVRWVSAYAKPASAQPADN